MNANRPTIYKNSLNSLRVKFLAGSKSKLLPGWCTHDIVSPYNKLYYVLDGQMYGKINGEEFIAEPGDCVMIPANARQSFENRQDKSLLKYWIHFNTTSDEKDIIEKIKLPYMVHMYNNKMKEDLKLIISLWQKDDITSLYTKSTDDFFNMYKQKSVLLQIIADYIEATDCNFEHSDYDPRIEQIMRYVEHHIAKDISVATLAEYINLNPIYFIRFFKQQTGKNPIDFLTKTRVSKAKELIRSTDFTFNDISAMVGIPNYSYFARVFKHYTGFTPSQYRNAMENIDMKTYPPEMGKKVIYKI